MGTNESDMPKPEVAVNDVIQLDPEKHRWGPLFAIVDEVGDRYVRCYWLHAYDPTKPPGQAYYRAAHGTFVRIGVAEWTFGS
jgi:hypothetical protein